MIYEAVADFHIITGKGVLKIRAGQTLDLPEDKAQALIHRGKIKGANISWDVLSSIHLDTARNLAGEDVNFRLSTPAITQAEDELNKTWIDCLHGRATLSDFKVTNEQWVFAIRVANVKAR